MNEYKVCHWCGERKTLNDYHIKRNAADGHQKYCKLCRSSLQKQDRDTLEGRAKAAARAQNYSQNNREKLRETLQKRRAKKKSLPTFTVSLKELKQLYSSRCFYCRVSQSQELDHVIPTSRGGSHGIGNLVGACSPCNRSKQDKTIMEWRVWRLRLQSRA
jgi:5-methylcytosine-specific restriction endonuclease McrA